LDEVVRLVENWLATFPDVSSAIERLELFDVPCAPVLSVEETITHPHLVERGTVRSITDPIVGEFKIPGMPIKTSGYTADSDYVAPRLGEHNSEILSVLLKKSDKEIKVLSDMGVLRTANT
jgi:crotonobetainyl-CoA:carnitine CoA-transferase CaiB-like acyl-CoA transferase